MVKILVIIISSVNIFAIYETLIKTFITILLITCKSKTKIGSARFICKKWQVISTIYNVFDYNFWWKCSEFSDKINLTIQMKIFKNVKHRHVVCVTFGDRFFTPPTMLGCETKSSFFSAIMQGRISYWRKFSSFVATVVNNHILIKKSASQKKPACKRNG